MNEIQDSGTDPFPARVTQAIRNLDHGVKPALGTLNKRRASASRCRLLARLVQRLLVLSDLPVHLGWLPGHEPKQDRESQLRLLA